MRTTFKRLAATAVLASFGAAAWADGAKAPGQTIWRETFDSLRWAATVAGDTAVVVDNLPDGWGLASESGQHWRWSLQGPRGRHTSPNGGAAPRDQLTPAAAIASATAADGFLLLPSDWYNTRPDGSSLSPAAAMSAEAEFGPLDFTGFPAVHLRFSYALRVLSPDAGGDHACVEVSADGGATWEAIHIAYTSNVATGTVVFDDDLTALLAGQPDCRVRFAQRGSTHYYFMLDDIEFYQPLSRDLRAEDLWLDYVQPGPLGVSPSAADDFMGGYHSIPLGVAAPFAQFRAAARNFGGDDRHGVYAQVTVDNTDDPELNPVYEASSEPLAALAVGQRAQLVVPGPFAPKAPGRYTATALVTDGAPGDTALDAVARHFAVTDSLYSYVDTAAAPAGYLTQRDYSASPDALGVGQMFYVGDIGDSLALMKNIGFYIHAQSANSLNQGVITVQGNLYRKEGPAYQLVQSTDVASPTGADAGRYMSLPFADPQPLAANTDYLLALRVMGETDTYKLRLGCFSDLQSSYGRSGVFMADLGSVASISKTPALYTYVVGGRVPRETDILRFAVDGQATPTVIDAAARTVSLAMPYGADLTSLVPTFRLSLGAVASVSGAEQQSGVSAVDFTAPVEYAVANAGDTALWQVTVANRPAPTARFASFGIPGQVGATEIVDSLSSITVAMPAGTDVTALAPVFVADNDAVVTVGGEPQQSGATAHDFTQPVVYRLTSYDGTVARDWTATVVEAAAPAGPAFVAFAVDGQLGRSEIDAQARTVAAFLPFGSEADITALAPTFELTPATQAAVAGVPQESGVSVVDFTSAVEYTLTREQDTALWSVAVAVAAPAQADIVSYAIAGQQGASQIDAQAATVTLTMPAGSDVTALAAVFELSPFAAASVAGVPQQSGATVNDFSDTLFYDIAGYDGVAARRWAVSVRVAEPTVSPEFVAFAIDGQLHDAAINPRMRTVDLTMPAGADLTALVPTFQLTPGAVAYIGTQPQESGVSAVDFTSAVEYTLVTPDEAQAWTVTVGNTPLESGNGIVAFALPGQLAPSRIDASARTVFAVVHDSVTLSAAVPTFELSPGATAFAGGEPLESGATALNLASPAVVDVVAEDGGRAEWQVEARHYGTLASGAEILSFGFAGQTQPSVIDPVAATIDVNLTSGQSLGNLIPLFTLSDGARAYAGATLLSSGASIVDFSASATIRVEAQNMVDSREWTVRVTTNGNAQCSFEHFYVNLGTVNVAGVIYAANRKITIEFPDSLGVDLSAVAPSWSVSAGATVLVGGQEQSNGQSAVDMRLPVSYTVRAQNGVDESVWVVYASVAGAVGVDAASAGDAWASARVYPNPASGWLRVELPEDLRGGEYVVYDIAGNAALAGEYRGLEFDVDIAGQAPGVYFVKIVSGRQSLVRKLIFK